MASRRSGDGFTLIEMLTVVAIVGLLATVALPSYSHYLRRARSAEPPSQLANMFTTAAIYGTRSTIHVGPSMGMGSPMGTAWGYTQAVQCQVQSSMRLPATPGPDKQVVDFRSDPSFAALGFSIADPIYYAYQIRARGGMSEAGTCMVRVGSAYTFTAVGDLDGDGVRSLYELAAGWNDTMELYRAPGIYVERGLE